MFLFPFGLHLNSSAVNLRRLSQFVAALILFLISCSRSPVTWFLHHRYTLSVILPSVDFFTSSLPDHASSFCAHVANGAYVRLF